MAGLNRNALGRQELASTSLMQHGVFSLSKRTLASSVIFLCGKSETYQNNV